MEDFARRDPAGLERLIILIRAGVFRLFGITKKEQLWRAHTLVNSYQHHQAVADLFDLEEANWSLPPL